MRTAAILYWDHPVSVVEEAALAMGRALTSLGMQVRTIGVMDARLNVKESVISECLSDPELLNCDVVFSMGGPPLAIRVGEQWLFEILGKTFHLVSMDALFYDYTRVRGVAEFLECAKVSSRLGIMWVDRDACRLLDRLTARPTYYLRTVGSLSPLGRTDRLKRIAVVATMGDELAPVGSGFTFEDLVLDAPPSIAGHPRLVDFARAIERPGPIEGIPNLAAEILGMPAAEIYTFEVARYMAYLDAFQKRRRRKETVDALRDVPIDFFGPGWEPYTGHFRDCRYMGSVPFIDLPNLFQHYSAILDFNPGFGHGLHDRVLTSVGNGCRALTNSCRAISDLDLPDPDAIIPYEVGDPNLAEAAYRALALPEMEPASLIRFRTENSWLARMDDFLFQLGT